METKGFLFIFIVCVTSGGWLLWENAKSRSVWASVSAIAALVGAFASGAAAVGYLYSSLVVLGLAMGYFWLESKNTIWGRPLAALCCMGIMVIAVAKMARIGMGIDHVKARVELTQKIDDANLLHERARFTEIGRVIGMKFVGARALVILPPTEDTTATLRMESLKEGLTSLVPIGAKETLSAVANDIEPNTNASTATTFDAKKFDQIVKYHSDCTLIISLVGLPPDVEAMKLWERDAARRPKLVLVDSNIGAYKELFAKNMLQMAIVQRADGYVDIQNTKQLADRERYFGNHYLVVTGENWEKMYKEHKFQM